MAGTTIDQIEGIPSETEFITRYCTLTKKVVPKMNFYYVSKKKKLCETLNRKTNAFSLVRLFHSSALQLFFKVL